MGSLGVPNSPPGFGCIVSEHGPPGFLEQVFGFGGILYSCRGLPKGLDLWILGKDMRKNRLLRVEALLQQLTQKLHLILGTRLGLGFRV